MSVHELTGPWYVQKILQEVSGGGRSEDAATEQQPNHVNIRW